MACLMAGLFNEGIDSRMWCQKLRGFTILSAGHMTEAQGMPESVTQVTNSYGFY